MRFKLLSSRTNDFWSFALLRTLYSIFLGLFLRVSYIMAQVIIYHEGIKVRVRLKSTSSISRVTQTTINPLFFKFSEISFLLQYLFYISHFFFLLEVLLFNLSDAFFILNFKFIKFIKTHWHIDWIIMEITSHRSCIESIMLLEHHLLRWSEYSSLHSRIKILFLVYMGALKFAHTPLKVHNKILWDFFGLAKVRWLALSIKPWTHWKFWHRTYSIFALVALQMLMMRVWS